MRRLFLLVLRMCRVKLHSQAIQVTKIRSVSIRNPNVRYNKEEYDCVTCRELRKSKYENQGWEKGERGRKLR